jgi:hypothetical protein
MGRCQNITCSMHEHRSLHQEHTRPPTCCFVLSPGLLCCPVRTLPLQPQGIAIATAHPHHHTDSATSASHEHHHQHHALHQHAKSLLQHFHAQHGPPLTLVAAAFAAGVFGAGGASCPECGVGIPHAEAGLHHFFEIHPSQLLQVSVCNA